MSKGQQAGKTDQDLEAYGGYQVDQDQVHDEIVVFIGTNTKQRSYKGDGHKDKKNSKPCPHKPGAKDPFVLPVTKHSG
jgi:hypothetical protein